MEVESEIYQETDFESRKSSNGCKYPGFVESLKQNQTK